MPSVGADDVLVPDHPIGPYRPTRVLGRGGMGTVFLAEDPSGSRVAVKVINRDVANKPEFRERFRREVTAAREVRPFCTAPVLDADLNGDPLYVVTEYIQGPTLEHVVSAYRPLCGSDLEGLAAGVATALVAIHAAGVVHRDLKPANILLSPFGPRVIDFGIARRLGVDAPLTQTGDSMGTPSYMAPESLVGEPITAAADVFAWGCVVTFAGTGRPPFSGENVGETLYNTVHGTPRLDGLEPRMRELVARATSKQPAERPTAVQLLEALTGHSDPGAAAREVKLAGPTAPDVPTPPPGAVRDGRTKLARLWPGRGRRRWSVAGAGAVAVAAATAATVTLWPSAPGDAVPSAKEILMSEPFTAGTDGWKAPIWAVYTTRVAGGVLDVAQQSISAPYETHAVPLPESEPPRVLVGATVTVKSADPADEAGVFCRGDGKIGYQILVARNGNVRVRKSVGERSGTVLGRSAGPVAGPGRAVKLQAACVATGTGIRVTAWAGGHKAVEATDAHSALSGGKAGILVGREGRIGGSSPVEASFDDFSVSRI